MVNIIGLFALLSGVVSTVAFARNIGGSVKSISHFILGLSVLLLAADYFYDESDKNQLIAFTLIALLSSLFFIGELTKSKHSLAWNILPLISVGALAFIRNISSFSFLGYGIDGLTEVLLIAALSAVTPFLTHLAKLGISNLIIRFGSIRWADNEDNYLESMVSYAFIGGITALGGFLTGPFGILIAATFYTGASLIARNKLGLKNDTLLTAGSAMYLIIGVFLLLEYSGFPTLDFTRGEVLEGAFVGGFTLLIYDLLLLLARHNSGKWKIILTIKAIVLPLIVILVLALAYTQLERLGGMLSISALLLSLALISVIFSLFKDYTIIGLKLIVLGGAFLLAPHFRPVKPVSAINMEELGIEVTDSSSDAPESLPLDAAIGKWEISTENSKIYFELGPEKGRTKGEIQSISGHFSIPENTNDARIKLVMKVNSLTTYIPDRDEHLMQSDYFNEPEFPEITFVSNEIARKGDHYLVNGQITMMGVTKNQTVELRIIGVGEKDGNPVMVLSGKSRLNRTDFGQSSSAKIGDIVDFNYEVQLVL